jgi:hypothetical protein
MGDVAGCMTWINSRKLISSLAMSALFVLARTLAVGDAGANRHNFWGSASTEPEYGIKVATRWASPTGPLVKKFPATKYRLYTIDIDQDGKDDYIAESKTEGKTCFIKSDFTIQNCEDMNLALADGFSYQYFVNLDPSEMLYRLDLNGDEDTDDYSLEQFDKRTWKLQELFKVHPLVNSHSRERSGIYWGYPWDIHGLPTKIDNGIIKIEATLDYHSFDTPYGKADPGVVILFDGVATQGPSTGQYNKLKPKLQFMSLKEILNRYAALSSQSRPKKKS